MEDQSYQITRSSAVAICLWLTTVALLSIATFRSSQMVAAWGLANSAAAATATVRHYLIEVHANLRNALEISNEIGIRRGKN